MGRKHLNRCLTAALTLLLLLSNSSGARAQRPATREFSVFAEALAGGVQYLLGTTSFAIGVALSGGPMNGVALADEPSSDTDAVGSAHIVIGYLWPNGRLLIAPIGAALLSGGDFSAVYPSAQAGIDFVRGRWRFGSHVRVIRIAGPNNSADYWTEWLPVRIGYALTQ